LARRTGVHKKGEISFEDILTHLRNNPRLREAGAVACFIGIVRGSTHDGRRVRRLEVEAYSEVAEGALRRIADDLRQRDGVVDVLIHHNVGSFSVGEDLVYVVVAGRSRKNVFSVLMEAVERYKHEAPLWKKETLEDGKSYWVTEAAGRDSED